MEVSFLWNTLKTKASLELQAGTLGKKNGGVGMQVLETSRVAPLAKQDLKLTWDPRGLWTRISRAKYLKQDGA